MMVKRKAESPIFFTMKAVFTVAGARVQLRDTEIPVPHEGQALIKVVAVAQNPTDCSSITKVSFLTIWTHVYRENHQACSYCRCSCRYRFCRHNRTTWPRSQSSRLPSRRTYCRSSSWV